MGAAMSRFLHTYGPKACALLVLALAMIPRRILTSVAWSLGNVAYGGLGIFVVTVMVLVMREAYTVVQIQKKQERDLLKQKEIDKKNAALFKSAREKLERLSKRSDRKRLLSCSLFLSDVCNMSIPLSSQLGDLVELFVRDFICNWWNKIGTDTTFVDDVRVTALGAVVELSRRASTVNVPVFLATDVLDALRHHIIWFKELSRRVASKHSARTVMGSVNTKFFEDRNRLIEAALRSEGRMHVACESEEAEVEYLRHITKEILARILTSADYECPMVRHLFREAISHTILLPLISAFSEPNYMNWIVEKIFDDSANSMSADTTTADQNAAAPGSARPENDMQDEEFDSLKDDETISKRYYAGVMSDKLAEKYLNGYACMYVFD